MTLRIDFGDFLAIAAAIAAPTMVAGCRAPEGIELDEPAASTGAANPSSTTGSAEADASTGSDSTVTNDSTSTGEGTTGSTGADSSGGGSSTTTTGVVPQDCCLPGAFGGCGEASVEACVCAQDPACCDAHWDDLCAAEVELHDCGDCPEFVAFMCSCDATCDGTAPVEAQLGICAADAAVANDLGAAVCADEISNICEGAEEASCGVCDCSPSAESNACD